MANNNPETATLYVKVDTQMNLTVVEQVNYGEKVVINAALTPSDAGGNVTFYINGKEYKNVTISNGIASLVLENVSVSYYRVIAKYAGDDTHYASEDNVTEFEIPLINTALTISVNNIIEGQNATIRFDTNATGNLSVRINTDAPRNVVIKNGVGELNLTGLAGGVYKVVVNYPGSDRFKSAENETNFTVYRFEVL